MNKTDKEILDKGLSETSKEKMRIKQQIRELQNRLRGLEAEEVNARGTKWVFGLPEGGD